MSRVNSPIRPGLLPVLVWLALGVAVDACVAKAPFQCQSDAACVQSDGTRGTCEASGECAFKSALGSQGGSSGDGGSGPSSAGSPNAADGGKAESGGAEGGGAGEAGTLGDGGASCTDESARNCYACKPSTSEQFLNACTSAACAPFDNHARLSNLTPSGELPPLPPVSGQ